MDPGRRDLVGDGRVRRGAEPELAAGQVPISTERAYDRGEFPEPYDVSRLATDPEVLATQLRDGTFDGHVVLLLEAPYATPELRAALFRGEPSRRHHGDRGRPRSCRPAGGGAGDPERDGDDISTWRTYFDPGTHQALAWTFRSSRGGSAWILLESGIVDAVGEEPVADESLAPPIPERPRDRRAARYRLWASSRACWYSSITRWARCCGISS
jgi:hypothetical protein